MIIGGGVNTSASTYLEWMFYPYGSNYYTSDGLNIVEYYGSYRKYPNTDIWINFCYTSRSNNGDSVGIYAPYIKISSPNINIPEVYNNKNNQPLSYDEAYNIANKADDETFIDPYYVFLNTISTRRAKVNIIGEISTSIKIFNIHITKTTLYYYSDSNLIGSVENPNYQLKYFCIYNGISNGRSRGMSNSYATLHWITLTDQMSTEIPQPPYTLDEKNNELYGYKK